MNDQTRWKNDALRSTHLRSHTIHDVHPNSFTGRTFHFFHVGTHLFFSVRELKPLGVSIYFPAGATTTAFESVDHGDTQNRFHDKKPLEKATLRPTALDSATTPESAR